MTRAADVQAWLEPLADEMAALLEELVSIDTENPPGWDPTTLVRFARVRPSRLRGQPLELGTYHPGG